MEQSKEQALDQLLSMYRVTENTADYKAMFWAKVAQKETVSSQRFWTVPAPVMAVFCMCLIVVIFGIKHVQIEWELSRLSTDQIQMIAVMDALEVVDDIDVVEDLDIIEHLDDIKAG